MQLCEHSSVGEDYLLDAWVFIEKSQQRSADLGQASFRRAISKQGDDRHGHLWTRVNRRNKQRQQIKTNSSIATLKERLGVTEEQFEVGVNERLGIGRKGLLRLFSECPCVREMDGVQDPDWGRETESSRNG
jgi:hypothetical protein